MKVQIDLHDLFINVARDCDIDPFTIQYCRKRFCAEGLKFWTVTLPKLAKVVLLSIERGYLCHRDSDVKFTAIAWKGCSLLYFRSLLNRIFCQKTGKILSAPDPAALRQLRIFCEYVYKLCIEFNESEKLDAEKKFEKTQSEVRDQVIDYTWTEQLRKKAETYYKSLFRGHPSDALSKGVRPGPGSFSGCSRNPLPYYIWKQLPEERIGTCSSRARAYSGHFKSYPSAPTKVRVVDHEPSNEVLFVPKDSRGPRVIAREPLHTIRGQMAFFTWASEALMKDTHGRIQFLDQELNRDLARQGSINRRRATLDLKEASDRIKTLLVRRVGRNSPIIRWFLNNLRTELYKLPSGKRGSMAALAGMGSGLTFPMLAFIVHLSVCTSIWLNTKLPYKQIMSQVYVYGDDLIVPTEWVEFARKGLSNSGLVVNTDKSYVQGPFRESCGGDYLNGVDVTPVRLRLMGASITRGVFDEGRLSPKVVRDYDNLVVGLFSHLVELRKAYMPETAEYVKRRLLKAGYPVAYRTGSSSILGDLAENPLGVYLDNDVRYDSITSEAKVLVAYAVPVKERNLEVCPYKHLARYLSREGGNKTPLETSFELGNSYAGPYGEIAVPRRNKVRIGWKSIMSLTTHEFSSLAK